jgi:hypothetical protein
MLPESPGRREEGFNKSAMRNKIAAYRSKAVLKDRKFYRFGEVSFCLVRMSVYGLLLFASKLSMTDMARLRTYIRPLKLAHVDAGP